MTTLRRLAPAGNLVRSESGDPWDVLATELRPLVFQLYRLVRRAAPHLQLSPSQGAVLAALVDSGPMRVGQLADVELVRLPSMTEIVARLERDGLVHRRPDPADRRAVLVEATSEGRSRYQEIAQAREGFLRDRLVELSVADRRAIQAAVPALSRLLARGGPGSP